MRGERNSSDPLQRERSLGANLEKVMWEEHGVPAFRSFWGINLRFWGWEAVLSSEEECL